MQIDLGEFIDQHKEQVILSQLGHNAVDAKILDDLPHVLAIAVDVVIDVQLDITRILSQPTQIVKRGIIKLSPPFVWRTTGSNCGSGSTALNCL